MENSKQNRILKLSDYSAKAFCIVLLLCFLEITDILSYSVYLVIVFIFLMVPLDMVLPFYTILLPWERILGLPGIGSLTLLIQLVILLRIIITKRAVLSGGIRFLFVIYYAIYALFSFAANGNYSGFGLFFEFFLLELLFRSQVTEKKTILWEEIGKYYVFSMIVSCFFGLLHGFFAERWIDGLGRVPCYLGIQGANQTGFCLNIAILFILTTSIPRRRKLIELVICGGFLASTISFTSIACFFLVVVGCMLSNSIEGLTTKRSTK